MCVVQHPAVLLFELTLNTGGADIPAPVVTGGRRLADWNQLVANNLSCYKAFLAVPFTSLPIRCVSAVIGRGGLPRLVIIKGPLGGQGANCTVSHVKQQRAGEHTKDATHLHVCPIVSFGVAGSRAHPIM